MKADEIYQDNEHLLLALSKHSKQPQPDITAFDIQQLLNYILEIYAIRSTDKDTILELSIESCFPKEVTGEKTKLELILNFAIGYFIKNAGKDSVKVFAKLRQLLDEGFIIAFEIECNQTEEFNEQILESTFITEKNAVSLELVHHRHDGRSLEAQHFKELLRWLKGVADIGVRNGRIYLAIELPIAPNDTSKPITLIPTLSIMSKVKLNQYSTRWTKDLRKLSAPSGELLPETNDLVATKAAANAGKTRELVQAKLKLMKEIQSPQIHATKRRLFESTMQVAFGERRLNASGSVDINELLKAKYGALSPGKGENNADSEAKFKNDTFTDPTKVVSPSPSENRLLEVKPSPSPSDGRLPEAVSSKLNLVQSDSKLPEVTQSPSPFEGRITESNAVIPSFDNKPPASEGLAVSDNKLPMVNECNSSSDNKPSGANNPSPETSENKVRIIEMKPEIAKCDSSPASAE